MSIFLDDYLQIGDILKQNNIRKPFICCTKSFEKTKIFDYLKQFNPVVWDRIRPNPRFDDMIDAARIFINESCDFMIGAGGGSPMDSAKMIRLMTTNDVSKCLYEPMANNSVKALFIPTTSGTGAEATKTSVFYINETEKFSVHNLDFIPDYVLFDESLLLTVPDYQRKCTCLDTLSHAVESCWSVKANDESKEYAKRAITLFFENKDSYMNNQPNGNKGMLEASFYGGKAINITGTTAAHAMCYNITMNCNTAHGHSVALVLAKQWEYMLSHNGKVNDSRGREYVLKTFGELAKLMGGKNTSDGANIINGLLKEFDLPTPKLTNSCIDEFVSKVNTDRLGNNPTVLKNEDVKAIYNMIFE